MPAKLFLQWDEFCNNIHTSLASLRETNDFADVTLVCEDGQQVEAHQVILSASSPFFNKLLKRKRNAHPVIFMRGVRHEDLLGIVDFLYFGEARISQENLESFLAIADELQMDGLMKNDGALKDKREESNNDNLSTDWFSRQLEERFETKLSSLGDVDHVDHVASLGDGDASEKEKSSPDSNYMEAYDENGFGDDEPQQMSDPKAESRDTSNSNRTFDSVDQLDEMINSMLEKTDRKIEGRREKWVICKVCGKEGQGANIKGHIESHHLEGISLSCNLCEKIFKSKRTLTQHKLSNHSKPIKDIM